MMFAPRSIGYTYFSLSRRVAKEVHIQSFAFATGPGSNGTIVSRPFKILGIQQIAIGCENKEPLDTLWKGIFGLEPTATKRIDSENVEEDIVKLGVKPYEVEIDLMTPIDPTKTPKVHIPPLNHVGLWIDHLERAVEWMKKNGVRFAPGGIRKGAAGHNVIFIHPKGNEEAPIGGSGVLIELVQAPEEVVKKFSSGGLD